MGEKSLPREAGLFLRWRCRREGAHLEIQQSAYPDAESGQWLRLGSERQGSCLPLSARGTPDTTLQMPQLWGRPLSCSLLYPLCLAEYLGLVVLNKYLLNEGNGLYLGNLMYLGEMAFNLSISSMMRLREVYKPASLRQLVNGKARTQT